MCLWPARAPGQPAAAASPALNVRPAEPIVEPVVVRDESGEVTVRASRINEPVALYGLLLGGGLALG